MTWRKLFARNETLVAVVIVAFCIVAGLRSPAFFSLGTLFDLLRGSIVMGMFAMGVLLVLISGGIDVSFTAIGVFSLGEKIFQKNIPPFTVTKVLLLSAPAFLVLDRSLSLDPIRHVDVAAEPQLAARICTIAEAEIAALGQCNLPVPMPL